MKVITIIKDYTKIWFYFFGIFTTKLVQFNSTATPNMSIAISSPISVAAGVRVRVIRTNKDNQAQDLYSTILGQEV